MQVVKIAAEILKQSDRLLITRTTPAHAKALSKKFKKAVHHETARCVVIEKKIQTQRAGTIAILSAGTSDLPVAEEAAVTPRRWVTLSGACSMSVSLACTVAGA